MTAKFSDRDWELLSTYLDGALSPENHRQVEARISSDAEFRAAYTSLRRTRGILRAVPAIRRRRNFYLTPELIRSRGWTWLIPTLNFSSAAAGILAFVFLLMDILPLARLASPPPPAFEAAPLIQATQELVVMDQAQVETPIQEPKMAAEHAGEMPTEISVESIGQAGIQDTENAPVDQMPALNAASGGGDVQNQVTIPEPPSEAPAAAPLPLKEDDSPSGAGELEDAHLMTVAPASSPQPTVAVQRKGVPTGTPVSIVETTSAPMVDAPGIQSNPPETGIEQPAVNEESAPQILGSAAESPAPTVVQSAIPQSEPAAGKNLPPEDASLRPEAASQPWPASRTGGIFLFVSVGLAALSYVIKKRTD